VVSTPGVYKLEVHVTVTLMLSKPSGLNVAVAGQAVVNPNGLTTRWMPHSSPARAAK